MRRALGAICVTGFSFFVGGVVVADTEPATEPTPMTYQLKTSALDTSALRSTAACTNQLSVDYLETLEAGD